jgi:hypothetical protein
MATDIRSMVLTIAVIALVLVGLYLIDPTFFGLLKPSEGFTATMGADANYQQPAGMNEEEGGAQRKENQANANSAGGDATVSGFVDASGESFVDASGAEGFANMEDVAGPAAFASAGAPAGCYPRDQLTPGELLPKDGNSVWAQQNPMGTGSLKGKNFLSAGSLLGVNTVGQSLRNANYQLRSEPPNPQTPVSVFNIPTIEPDVNRRDFDIN